jgi:hypothetical protein
VIHTPSLNSPSLRFSRHSLLSLLFRTMFGSFVSVAVLALAATATAAPAALEERAATTCSFSGASGATAVASAKKSCATITLDSLVVPAGTTLDLTKLTKVRVTEKDAQRTC